MMTIHKLTAGDGYTYLTRQVASADTRRGGQDLAGYYTATGTPPGRWLGAGAADLGVRGWVSEAQMRALFGAGRHPDAEDIAAALTAAGATPQEAHGHARLGRPFPDYATLPAVNARVAARVQALLAETGHHPSRSEIARMRGEEAARQRRAVAGYDLVFSPVKSISLLWALGDDRTRAAVEAAHHSAVADTLAWLERNATFTRIGVAGALQVQTHGLVAAAFDPKPAAPTATTLTSSGTVQQVQVAVRPGDSVSLVDFFGRAVSQVIVAGQGTYTIDPTTAVIRFTPVTGFSGAATGVNYRVADSYGQSALGLYRPTVTGPAAPVTVTVVVPALSILKSRDGRLPVTCRVSAGAANSCTVTLIARIGGRTVVVGTGRQAVAPGRRELAVSVTLTRLGRALAAAPGGINLTVSAKAVLAAGSQSALYGTGRTRVVVAATFVPHPVFFDTGKSQLRPDEIRYLTGLRTKLAGVHTVTCDGYTDSRASVGYNARLAMSRAQIVCAFLLRGTRIKAVTRSYGESRPHASNADMHGRALNRRTEIRLGY